jgi:hypothetical protein
MSSEFRDLGQGAVYLMIAVVIVVITAAIGSYTLGALQSTGAGNSTIYRQGNSILYNVFQGFGNAASLATVVFIIIVAAIVLAKVAGWLPIFGGGRYVVVQMYVIGRYILLKIYAVFANAVMVIYAVVKAASTRLPYKVPALAVRL